MTSKECFVYIQLPNSSEVVTAGKFKWQRAGANSEVGSFVYAKSYLKRSNAIALDPLNLPLKEQEYRVTTNEGVHGPIRDASPDSWGRYVIQKNTPIDQHDPVGYLLNSADDRVGALSFGYGKEPPAPVRKFNKTIDLEDLIKAAHKLEKQDELDEVEKAILMVGPSIGGARPKTTVKDDNELWLAKFPAFDDKQNFPKIEYGTMLLAKRCGINVPDVKIIKVGKHDVFLIKRFDRQYDQEQKLFYRTHFVSGLTLLNLDERDYDKWSYIDLADQMRRWIEKPKKDLEELFKRIVFNGLVSNTDDHPRNHGFIYNENGYRLSPVYDLVPKFEHSSTRYLAMSVGLNGREFSIDNILSSIEAFELTKEEGKNTYKQIKQQIEEWASVFSKLNLSEEELLKLENTFTL